MFHEKKKRSNFKRTLKEYKMKPIVFDDLKNKNLNDC